MLCLRLKKWYLMPLCLTIRIIRYLSKVKWSYPGKRVAPTSTLYYRIGSLWVTLWSPLTAVANLIDR